MVALEMGQGRRGRRLEPHHAGEGARCGEMDQATARSTRSAASTSRACRCSAQRAFSLRIPGGPTGGPFGDNKLVYHDEFLATEIGQTGTQFDGLGHIGIQMGKDGDKSEMRFYNGFTAAEISDAYGLKKLGTEKLKPLFTRGHLVDMVALKGGMMDAGQEITVADIARGAAEAEHAGERHQAGRRDLLPYRLGLAVDEEQRPLQQRRAGHRPRSRPMGDREGPRA